MTNGGGKHMDDDSPSSFMILAKKRAAVLEYERWAGMGLVLAGAALVAFILSAPNSGLPAALIPWLAVLAVALSLVPNFRSGGFLFLLWFPGMTLLGILVEIAAAALGIPGARAYGPGLGLALRGVPLVAIPFQLLVLFGALCVARHVFRRDLSASVLAAAMTVGLDWLALPVAERFGFWVEPEPLDYAIRLAVGAVVALSFRILGRRAKPDAPGLGRCYLPGVALVATAAFLCALRLAWFFGLG